MITQKEFVDIKNWICRNARPLDYARWKYYFENGQKEDVLAVLASYQNQDGGFGHALEADLWNPNSTPIHTGFAVLVLSEIEMFVPHYLVDGILRYLESGKDYQHERWLALVPSNNEFPRGPWWNYEDRKNAEWGYNPTLILTGFILLHADKRSELYNTALNIAKEAVEKYTGGIRTTTSLREGLCFVYLMDFCHRANILQSEMMTLKNILLKNVDIIIEKDSLKWKHHCWMPSDLIKTPQSVFYPGNEKLVDSEINFLLKTRTYNGVWDINWTWGDSYPEKYAVSANWWRAYMTINKLCFLRNFGQVEHN